ncbi:hypothetical protein EBZ39_12190 [bacterium]|nr:hypothetical protein [bacterium]
MTRESLWTNSAPLAALSSHWWAHNSVANSRDQLLVMPYAQDTRRGLLEEYKLPFFDQIPAQTPANLRFLTGAGMPQETINGRVFSIHDAYSGIVINGVGSTGGLYFIDYLRTREGRDAACHRGRGFLSSGSFPQSVGFDYEPWTDAIGLGVRALKPRYVTALAMFVPRSGGQTTWGGVYACARPVVRRAMIPHLGAEIKHTDMWLPPCDLYEIGELQNAQMTSRDRVLKPARKPGQVFVYADLGLALEQDGEETRMLFSCNAGMSVLEFPFAPESRDAMLAALIHGESSPFSYGLSFGINHFIGLTQCPFSGLGQFRGFPLITADHGGIVHLSHFAGAATTPPYPNVGPSRQRVPRVPEWGTWPHSMYPYTPHANAIAALEDDVRLGNEYPSRVKKTPIYSVFEHAPNDFEMYPSREVVAFAACLQPTQFGPVFSPYTSLANNMLAKPPNNGMVVCGKQIKSVTVRFGSMTRFGICRKQFPYLKALY